MNESSATRFTRLREGLDELRALVEERAREYTDLTGEPLRGTIDWGESDDEHIVFFWEEWARGSCETDRGWLPVRFITDRAAWEHERRAARVEAERAAIARETERQDAERRRRRAEYERLRTEFEVTV